MEAAKSDPRSASKCDGRGGAPVHSGIWTVISSARTSVVYRAKGSIRLRAGRPPRWNSIDAAYGFGLRIGGRVPETSHPLDVVASDWRARHWIGRTDLSTGAGRGVRNYWRLAPGKCDRESDSWRAPGEMVYLGCVARIRHFGRSSGAAADDGRRTRRSGGNVPAQRRSWVLAAHQHGSDLRGHDALAVYQHYLCVRVDARCQRFLAAAGGQHGRPWV